VLPHERLNREGEGGRVEQDLTGVSYTKVKV
jgi:hypothetical protein